MENLWRGRPLRLACAGSERELVRRLRAVTVDDVVDFLSSGTFGARDPAHLLAGVVYPEKVRLRIPDRDRAPFWLLSPVFLGRVVAGEDGNSELVGRVRLRRTTLVLIAIPAVALAALLPLVMGVVGVVAIVGAILAAFALQVAFVLPATREVLVGRLAEAAAGATGRARQPQS